MRRNSRLRYGLGEIVAAFFIYSGIARLYLKRRLARNEATAFFLHDPAKDVFEKLMRLARRWGFVFIDDRQLLAYLNGAHISDRPLLHISIDDGWLDNLSNVVAFAEKNTIPITYFLCTEALESGDFWWNRVGDFATAARLRKMKNADRMQYLKEHVPEFEKMQPDAERKAMNSAEVRSLAQLSHATIGNHTHHHPNFSNCSDAEIEFELTEAHRRLTQLLDRDIVSFAYPCGSTNGYEQQVLQRLGYQIAFTTEPRGLTRSEKNSFAIPRFEDDRQAGVFENFCRLIGLWDAIYIVLRAVYRRMKSLPVLAPIFVKS